MEMDVAEEWDEKSRVYEVEKRPKQRPASGELRLRRAIACLDDLGHIVHRVADRPLRQRPGERSTLRIQRVPAGVFGCFQLVATLDGCVRFVAVTTNVRSLRTKEAVSERVPAFSAGATQEVWVWLSDGDVFAVYAREAVTGLWMTMPMQELTPSARQLTNLAEASARPDARSLRPQLAPRSRSRRSGSGYTRRADTG